MSAFDELNQLDLTGRTEKKKTGKKTKDGKDEQLTYLSWPWAWAEVKKRYPDASYEIEKFDGLPYVYDEKTGYMVYTKVTIEEVTHEMWLPVMDGKMKAMKAFPYEYETKYGTNKVEAATMFDVNKTVMRCLVKNLAMFGLGLYIYAGEDLPDDPEKTKEEVKNEELVKDVGEIKISEIKQNILYGDIEKGVTSLEKLLKYFKVENLSDVTEAQFRKYNDDKLRAEKEKKK